MALSGRILAGREVAVEVKVVEVGPEAQEDEVAEATAEVGAAVVAKVGEAVEASGAVGRMVEAGGFEARERV